MLPCWDEEDFAMEDYEEADLHDETYDVKIGMPADTQQPAAADGSPSPPPTLPPSWSDEKGEQL